MTIVKAKIGENGRVVIPAAFRKELGLSEGDEISMSLEDWRINITSSNNALKAFQKVVKEKSGDADLVSELLEMRKEEVKNDQDS